MNTEEITLAPITVYADDTYEKERHEASNTFAESTVAEEKTYTEEQIKKDTKFSESYTKLQSFLYPGQETEVSEITPDDTATMTPEEIEGGVKEFKATPTQEDLASSGMQMVSDFKNALYTVDDGLGIVGTYMKLKDAPADVKEAALYMWDRYEAADITGRSVARAFKSMGKDPLTYTPAVGYSFFGKNVARKALESRFTTMLMSGTAAGSFTAGEETLHQEVQNLEEYDLGEIAKMGGMGFAIGLVAPPAIEGTIKAVGATGRGIKRGVETVYKEGEELAMRAAGGGTPPQIDAQALIDGVGELTTKEQQKQLSASLRFLEGEEKAKVIGRMKELSQQQPPKPKTAKVQEVITAREDFNEQFYSRAEHSFGKVSPESTDVHGDLLKDGVKQGELDSLGIKPNDDYNTVQNKLNFRVDTISKNTLDADTAGTIIDEDDYLDYLDVNEGTNVRTGDSGYGTRITDQYTGADAEIGMSYHDDVYVDDSGIEFDYEDMLDDWYEYYSSDYKERATAELIDEGEELTDDLIKEKTFELAEDDYPWGEYYFMKEYYESELSDTRYDTMDEAVEDTKQLMYEDYRDRAEFDGAGEIFEDYTVDGGDNYKMEVYRMKDFTGEGTTHYEPHLEQINQEADNVQVHARMKTRIDSEGNTGTVLEEVQSQWEQDWRKEGGGKKLPTKAERAAAQIEVDKIEKEALVYDKKYEALRLDRQNIEKRRTEIRQKHKAEIQDEVQNLYKQKNDLEEIRKNNDRTTDEGFERDYETRKQIEVIEGKAEDLEGGYKNNPEYIELGKEIEANDLERTKVTRTTQEIRHKQRPFDKIVNAAPPKVSAPPLKNRTQYTKLAMLDNLTKSLKEGEDYFGWINGHIQNGSKINTTVGMSQAYDIEMPRIIQKATGETPYMASFDDGLPISGEKIKWDGKRASNLEYYDELAEGETWYWRVDYTPELKKKLKDAKIEMYGVGGVSLVGADELMKEDEDVK